MNNKIEKLNLHKHNKVAYEKVKKSFQVNNRCCVIHPTGTGKSFISLALISDHLGDNILYVTSYAKDLQQFESKMNEYLGDCENVDTCLYSGLQRMVLSANSTEFKVKALGPYKAFSRRNGILEATVKLTKLADFTSQILGLDRDLMLAGAMMYYVGYIDCMDDAFNITADDILIGAGTNAANRIKTQVQKILSGNDEQLKMSVDMTDVKLLCHMVMSRYKGIQPATAEAYALRYLDAMVTEVDSVETALSGYEPGSIITPLYGYGKLLKR